MLTIEQVDHNLKITWVLAKPISSDLTEFSKINTLDEKVLINEGVINIIGEEEIPLLLWREFLSFVKVLLDRHVKLQFCSSNEKIVTAMNQFGFSLLGEVRAS